MPIVSARQVITDAVQTLNVYMPGDTLSTNDAATGLRFLNLMIGQWAQQSLTIPAEQRLVFPLQAGKGSPANPYSLGDPGDLTMTKPPNQNSVTGCGLLLNASTPPVEIPRGLMTNEAYDRLRIKDLTSTLFTNAFYLPQFMGGDSGFLFLYPVPTDLTNSLVLYVRLPMSTFVDLDTQYSIPMGYDDTLYKCLMATTGFARAFGRTADKDLKDDARESFNILLRSNVQLVELENDFAHLGQTRGVPYNLQTGE